MRPAAASSFRANQEGSVIVIAMMFALVFLILGTALFVLNRNATAETHLERKDVKAFNVAEAGVDAAIVALKADWPRSSGTQVTVNPGSFRNNAFPDTREFPEPTHGQFIEVITYDDTEYENPDINPTTDVDERVPYDLNNNKVMWIDAQAVVDNARHRILLKVERLTMPVEIPDMALAANKAGGVSTAHGLHVEVDPDYHGTIPVDDRGTSDPSDDIYGAQVCTGGVPDGLNPVNPDTGIYVQETDGNPFSDYVPNSLIGILEEMAKSAKPESYFDDSDGEAVVESFIVNPATGPGSITYFKTNDCDIKLSGKKEEVGTPESPIVLVIDARGASGDTTVELAGNGDFHGVLIVLGNVELKGTSRQPIGCVLCEGSVVAKGGPAILYNGDYIRTINQMHTLSVAMVPNTWEEYTIAETSPSTTTTDTTVP